MSTQVLLASGLPWLTLDLSVDCFAGFLVPITMVSTNMPNKIGMSGLSWSQCFDCKAPYTCTNTSINASQSNLIDQLHQYKGIHVASVISNENASCAFLPGFPYSFASSTAKKCFQSLTCNYSTDQMDLALDFAGTTVGLVTVPQLPQIEILALNGTWSPELVVTLTMANTGRANGNFSVCAKQCCIHMLNATSKCYDAATGSLSYTNDQNWIIAEVSQSIEISTTISFLEDYSDPAIIFNTSNSFSCDLDILESKNLTTLAFFYSISNIYAWLGLNSSDIMPSDIPKNPSALSFDALFEGVLLALDQSVLKARCAPILHIAPIFTFSGLRLVDIIMYLSPQQAIMLKT